MCSVGKDLVTDWTLICYTFPNTCTELLHLCRKKIEKKGQNANLELDVRLPPVLRCDAIHRQLRSNACEVFSSRRIFVPKDTQGSTFRTQSVLPKRPLRKILGDKTAEEACGVENHGANHK